jgi:hypothetical protein
MGGAHNLAAERAARGQALLGVPLVVVTALLSTALFASLSESRSVGWRLSAAILAAIATVLSAFQAYLKFGERSEQHRTASAAYGQQRRELEMFLLRLSNVSQDPAVALADLENLMIKFQPLADRSPRISDSLYQKGRAQVLQQREEAQMRSPG